MTVDEEPAPESAKTPTASAVNRRTRCGPDLVIGFAGAGPETNAA